MFFLFLFFSRPRRKAAPQYFGEQLDESVSVDSNNFFAEDGFQDDKFKEVPQKIFQVKLKEGRAAS